MHTARSPLKLTLRLLTTASLITSAQATLLFYEGFSSDDYTEGELNGQPLVGEGYAPGGTWNTTSTFATEGLTYPGLPTTDGFHLLRSAGEVQTPLNLTPEGPFGQAGLVSEANNKIAGNGITTSLYFSVLARKEADGNAFAGFQIYDGGSEGFGVGQVTGGNAGAYKWLQGGSNAPLGNPEIPWVVGETNLFVFKINFNDTESNTATVWTNPDLALGEGSQDPAIVTDVNNVLPAEGFDVLRYRGSAVWAYDEVRIGTTWEDVIGANVAPPPALIITSIEYSPDTNEVTLTWDSAEGATYTVSYSTDLVDWSNELDDGVPADPGDSTTGVFNLSGTGVENADVLFFRVETNP